VNNSDKLTTVPIPEPPEKGFKRPIRCRMCGSGDVWRVAHKENVFSGLWH
jgi:hypothetical protein